MLFTFAGSGHNKYVNYLLEMISYLEYRLSPAKKEFFLKNWLVNPSGEPNGWQEQDLLQEHFNRDLEADVKRKDKDFGDKFLRSVVSRTVHHCSRVKKEMRMGLELTKKGNRHTPPHSRPEILALLRLYKQEELHSFRKGRKYPLSGPCLNAFREGTTTLGEKVEKWRAESYRLWVSAQNFTVNQSLEDMDNDEPEEESDEAPILGRGARVFQEGELFFFGDDEDD